MKTKFPFRVRLTLLAGFTFLSANAAQSAVADDWRQFRGPGGLGIASAGSNVSSPLYLDGRLYFASESNGSVYCLDGHTGALVYEEKLVLSPGKIYASPVLAGDKIYYVSRANGVYVVDAKPAFTLLAHNELGDKSLFDGSPAVAGNRMFLRSDKFLYCIGAK